MSEAISKEKFEGMKAAANLLGDLNAAGFDVYLCREHQKHVEIVNRNNVLVWSSHFANWPPNAAELNRLKDATK